MRTMTIEELLMKTEEAELFAIYEELDSRIIPSTGYAHTFIRKVNRMINEGKLCVMQDKYRNVYLPTVSNLIFKELARRYVCHCQYMKTVRDIVDNAEPVIEVFKIECNDDKPHECIWCGQECDESELHTTDIGRVCDHCIAAIRSRGEELSVLDY